MKILSRLRIKAEENWFDTLTDEQKKAYIEEHPDSKYAKNYRPSSPVNKAPMKGKPKVAPKKADDFESYIKGENKDYYEGVIDKIQYMAEDDGFDAVDSESLMDNLYNGAMYQISDAGYDYDDADYAATFMYNLDKNDDFIRKNLKTLRKMFATEE